MEFEAIAALVVLGLVLVALVCELATPAAIMLGGLTLFVLTGVVPVEQAFAGFSNPATISIAGLFVVSRAVRDHAGLDDGLARLLGDGRRSPRFVLARLVPPVIALSAVTNNTPIVATGAPLVRNWADRHGAAASQLLMPLSFAAILGGVVTVIGTSPNLVVSGVLEASGYTRLEFFELTPAGLPMAVLGGIVLIVLGPRLLPDRRTAAERLAGNERAYTLRLRVRAEGNLTGRSVTDAGLRDLPTTYLAAVHRNGHEIAPVPPDELLDDEDELIFVGRVDEVRDLLDHPGLEEPEAAQVSLLTGITRHLVECVVDQNSSLVGETLKSVSFRGRYGGAVVAVHRSGERLPGKLGAITLRAGDALLVLADGAFAERWSDRSDFAVVVPVVDGTPRGRTSRRALALASLLGMVGLAASGMVPVVYAILLACAVLVATRTIRFRRALDAMDRDVLVIVASAIGLGAGLEASGLAPAIGRLIERVSGGTSPVLALLLIVVGTMVLTELVTNVAAAALMAPIAISAAEQVGFDPTGFAIAVALAASSSFLTPIGYQTNTIVYGLGGYRFGDYWRLGLPLALGTVAVTLVVVPTVWG